MPDSKKGVSVDEGLLILIDTIGQELYHQDYKRVTDLAVLYKQLITGEDMDKLLHQFVMREDSMLFAQRKKLTQAITPSVSASLMTPFYKVGRVNSIIKKIDFTSTENAEEKKEKTIQVIDNYNGTKTLDKYLSTRTVELNFCDPNSFIVTEFDNVPLGPNGQVMEEPSPRPFEVSCFNAINYNYKNNILQWLIVRLPIKYTNRTYKKDSKLGETPYMDNETDGYSYTIYLNDDAIKFTQLDDKFMGISGLVLGMNQVSTEDGFKAYYRQDESKVYLVEYFNYKAGEVPAIRVGYKTDLVTDGRTCVSPMHDALPYFMKSIKTVSEFDITMALHAFPQKIQYAPVCQGEPQKNLDCRAGYTADGRMCGSCKGTGYAIHTSAQDAVIIRMPKNKDEQFDLASMIHYEHPPIDLLKFQDEFILQLKEESKQAVFNSEIFSKTEVTATATEKRISLEQVYDTLFPFAQHYSEIYVHIARVASKFVDVPDLIIIHAFPKDFKFKSVSELLTELKIAVESGAPGYIRQEISMDIAEQQFLDKPEELKVIRAKNKFYPFPDKTPTEIIYIISNNKTTKYNEILWSNFDNVFLSLELEAEDKGDYFYDYAYRKQKQLIDGKVNELISQLEEEKPITFAQTNDEIAGG